MPNAGKLGFEKRFFRGDEELWVRRKAFAVAPSTRATSMPARLVP